MLKLFFDNIQVAHKEGTFGSYFMVLEQDIHPFYVPIDLFVKGATRVPLHKLVDWVCQRVFPKERMDADKLLAQMGLTEYDPFEIAKLTRASMISDGWWVAFNEDDTFREHTIRGQSDFSEWVSAQEVVLKDPSRNQADINEAMRRINEYTGLNIPTLPTVFIFDSEH